MAKKENPPLFTDLQQIHRSGKLLATVAEDDANIIAAATETIKRTLVGKDLPIERETLPQQAVLGAYKKDIEKVRYIGQLLITLSEYDAARVDALVAALDEIAKPVKSKKEIKPETKEN